VPWQAHDGAEQRKSAALRAARELIDHACRATAVQPVQLEEPGISAVIEDVLPPALEGVMQELGLAAPQTKSRKRAGTLT
jgi:hypothetical protein